MTFRRPSGVRLFGAVIACLVAVCPAIAQTALPAGTVGVTYSYQVTTIPAADSSTVYGASGLPPGLSINVANGLINGTPMAAGSYSATISLLAGGATNNLPVTIAINPPPGTLTITSAGTATGTVGTAFSYASTTSVVAGAPATSFNLTALPPGLAGNSTTGVISGTPTTAGAYPVTISANNLNGTGAVTTLTITIAPAAGAPVINSAAIASVAVGAPFNYTITASNSPTSFSAVGLPLGLSLASATGVISGTPTLAGSSVVALTAASATGTGPVFNLTLTVGAVPVITSATTANVGLGAAFSFGVTATNSPTSYSIAGLPPGLEANTATGALSGTPTATGVYAVAVSASNATGTGPVVTLTITVGNLPTIAKQPVSLAANLGDSVTLTVAATGSVPLSYQWKKDTIAIDSATNSSLTIASVQSANVGSYTVVVTNGFGPITSAAATLSVLPTGNSATHTVLGGGYIAGSTVTITNTLRYAGTAAGLGWEVSLPAGWSFVSANGAYGDSTPPAGTTELIAFAWNNNIAATPLTFTYTLNVPAGQTGAPQLDALVIVRPSGAAVQFLAKPAPLVVAPLTRHSADTIIDGRIDLVELTRVIELYNTRNGTVRTGCYKVQAATEDGFGLEPTRAGTEVVTLARYHSADTNRDGMVNLFELTRVIELYNFRIGTVRSGQYHVQAGTEDGFAPGP